MAKFVCDYAQVTAAGEKLIQAASDLTTATNNYSSTITSDLSGWTGDAKNSFTTTCTAQVTAATEKAKYMNDFGEFIKSASQKIQALDDELASISI